MRHRDLCLFENQTSDERSEQLEKCNVVVVAIGHTWIFQQIGLGFEDEARETVGTIF
jgi:hypothetical protein